MVCIRVLGSLEAETNQTPIPLGGPRQRAVLALLVVARGQVVSIDRLIEDLWCGQPPAQALKTLQSYVSNLRRLLEAGRAPRTPARLLVSAAPGYALRLPVDAVDAFRFERLCRQARDAMADRPGEARSLLDEALALWRGPAFAEVADEPWAAAEVRRLEELRLSARELRVAAALRTGETLGAKLEAERLTTEQPLREEGWRLSALALWHEGRQSDALAALRQVRKILSAELGLNPGPALVELEDAILRQRTEVLHAAVHVAEDPPAAPARRSADPIPWAPTASDNFFGRTDELAQLTATAAEVGAHGLRIGLITGEAGAGKSALMAAFGGRLERENWLVATGRCPQSEGTPPAWAWSEALRAVAACAPPPPDLAEVLAPLISDAAADTAWTDAAAGRFHQHRAVWSWLGATARRRPVAIMLDDLHWADAETLALLAAAVDDPSGRRILVVSAFRPDEVGEPLGNTLAVLARQAPARLPLSGLSTSAVARLVEAVAEQDVDADTVAALAERTGGNPFYVKESARLLRSEGTLVAVSEVPEGVRDVLRRRLGRLPSPAVAVLRLVAVAGDDSDVDVLIDAADGDEDSVLDALDAGLISGLLTEPAPGRVKFVHALVRDTVAADLNHVRRTRMHGRLAGAIERLRPDDVAALAYHYSRAASVPTAVKSVEYCVRAAAQAEARYAHETAADLLTQALESFDRVPLVEHTDRDSERMELLGALLRAQIRAGAVPAARATRAAAVELAERAGRDDLLIEAFCAWTQPTSWQTHPVGAVDEWLVAHLSRLLNLDNVPAAVRCRLLTSYSDEVSGERRRGSLDAARAAVALADEVADPQLRALAIATLSRELVDGDQNEVSRLSHELIELGVRHDLPVSRWSGVINLARVAARRNDASGARRLVAQSLELARTYRLPEPTGVSECALAAFAHVDGRLDEAERRYAETTEGMRRRGSLHADIVAFGARATLLATRGRLAELAPQAAELSQLHGGWAVDVLGAALAAAGREDEARQMLATSGPAPHPLFFTIFASFRARAVIALNDRDAARRLYDSLLPYQDGPPAGLENLALTTVPVAHTLGTLAKLLGHHEPAAEHFSRAMAIADAWHAPQWTEQARAALRPDHVSAE